MEWLRKKAATLIVFILYIWYTKILWEKNQKTSKKKKGKRGKNSPNQKKLPILLKRSKTSRFSAGVWAEDFMAQQNWIETNLNPTDYLRITQSNRIKSNRSIRERCIHILWIKTNIQQSNIKKLFIFWKNFEVVDDDEKFMMNHRHHHQWCRQGKQFKFEVKSKNKNIETFFFFCFKSDEEEWEDNK